MPYRLELRRHELDRRVGDVKTALAGLREADEDLLG